MSKMLNLKKKCSILFLGYFNKVHRKVPIKIYKYNMFRYLIFVDIYHYQLF